jgi:rRNA maturation endonuclease Nob1
MTDDIGPDDNRHICPNCGNDLLDGQGTFGRSFNRVRSGEEKVSVAQKWVQLRCADCDQTFALLERETETEQEQRD